MIKAFSLVLIGLVLLPISLFAADYDNWKAPPPNPVASVKDEVAVTQHAVDPPLELPAHHLFVNEVVEQEKLPFISIEGYNLKIAINPQVLEKYGLKSGDLVTSEKMYEIIDADRDFQKGILK